MALGALGRMPVFDAPGLVTACGIFVDLGGILPALIARDTKATPGQVVPARDDHIAQ